MNHCLHNHLYIQKFSRKILKDCVDLYYERLKSEGLTKDFETLGQRLHQFHER